MLNTSPLQTEIQLHSLLRAHISLTHEIHGDEETENALSARRIQSRCFVYDIRNYKPINQWGPFLDDGSVNWLHIEHLANVVLINLRELPPLWATTIPPLGLENTRAYSAPGPHCDTDWAGVEGTWRRYVCFMDYRYVSNHYSNVAGGPRNPLFFHDTRFREATRLIEVKLHLISKGELRFQKPSCEGPNLNPRYPVLYFSGTSRGVSGNEAKIEGTVQIGVDGTPRWTFVNAMLISGSYLPSSKGVQIGGPC
ncbi:hypothetical protein BT96DRAFT_1042571 [Gymnopus androsaceus JB14]|uniref:Uncharacterized protein n=1 Tax=Gymnopus androsaceus JB14 TaxID=1447944 RepID=A0A6A4HFC3_9AGAR|nr:hypothetical protein BT96DRAFT_1042571 [Gymnopus androsaceus JB14]